MKAVVERRKKGIDENVPTVSGRVEGTRVNPNSLIDELLKNTKLDEDTSEGASKISIYFCQNRKKKYSFCNQYFSDPGGLQLFIARDGTASLGGNEVKSRLHGATFKQVVMDKTPR